ncbi:MAG: energy transducer TonB [Acidobacteriota bacterium]|nr:energy transducer TonB [Acidobacteriota bacterium]
MPPRASIRGTYKLGSAVRVRQAMHSQSGVSQSTLLSITIHVVAVAMLLLASKTMIQPAADMLRPNNIAALISPYIARPAAPAMGGGGGAHQQAPATAGRLPKIAQRQFVPPTLEITNQHPKLAMEMTIEAPPDTALPDRQLSTLGDPLSKFINNSAGAGGPLGIGNHGHGTGVGDKAGPRFGAGEGDIGPVYAGGRGITLPVVIHQVSPEFSEEARRAKHSGIVVLHTDVDATGHPRNIRVMQSLGLGLDEKAVEALVQWLFKPGTKDGKPVAVSAVVEVRFQLL